MTRMRALLLAAAAACLLACAPAVHAAGTSYLGLASGPGTTGVNTVQGNLNPVNVKLWDLRNLIYSPRWSPPYLDATKLLSEKAFCAAQKPDIVGVNGVALSGLPGSKPFNSRIKCAERLATHAIGRPLSATRNVFDLNTECAKQAVSKVRSICWYAVLGTYNADSQLHTREDSLHTAVSQKGVLAMNIVVWRYDTIDTAAGRNALRGSTVNLTSKTPIFQRRVGAWDDGGTYVAKRSLGADEGACASAHATGATHLCWGANDTGPFPDRDNNSRLSWWQGGSPSGRTTAAGNKTTWDNQTPIGGPLSQATGHSSSDCINSAAVTDLQGRPDAYVNATTTNGKKVWQGGADYLEYIEGKKPGSIASATTASYSHCTMYTGPASLPFYGFNTPHRGGGTDGNRVAYPTKQREAVSVAWRTPTTGGAPQVYYRIEGLPGALYIVQIYGLSSREEILSSRIQAFLGLGGVGGSPGGNPDPCPAGADCSNPTTDGGGDGGSDTSQPDPPTGLPDDLEGGAFPGVDVVLDAPKRIVRTGDSAPWNVSVVNESSLDDQQALFVTQGLFRLGEPQIDGNSWSRTIEGQPGGGDLFFNQANPARSRFRIQGQNGIPASYSFESVATWPWPDSVRRADGSSPIREILTATSPLTPTGATTQYGPGDSWWNSTFLTSTLIPSQNEDAPQLGQGGAQYQSGRWVERTRPIAPTAAGSCTAVVRFGRPGEEAVWYSTGTVGEGYYYHNGDDECNKPNVKFIVRVKGAVPAGTHVIVQSRDTDGDGNPTFRVDRVAGAAGAPITANATYDSQDITDTIAMPADDGAYQILVVFPGSGYQWRMLTSRVSDSGDQIQWAGHDSFGPGGSLNLGVGGYLGPDYDPLFGNSADGTSMSCHAGYCRQFSGGESGYQSLLIVGNQPTH